MNAQEDPTCGQQFIPRLLSAAKRFLGCWGWFSLSAVHQLMGKDELIGIRGRDAGIQNTCWKWDLIMISGVEGGAMSWVILQWVIWIKRFM